MNLYTQLVKHRSLLAAAHDALVACFAWFLAFQMRFNFEMPANFLGSLLLAIAIAVPIQIALFVKVGLYKGVWRFASIPDLKRIIFAAITSAVIITALLLMISLVIVPRSVLLLNPLLLILLMGGSRFAYRDGTSASLAGFRGARKHISAYHNANP